MVIEQTQIVDGYIYGVEQGSGQGSAINAYANLIHSADNWETINDPTTGLSQDAFISADKTNNPDYWTNAKEVARIVHNQVETVLQNLINKSWPLTKEIVLSLAPPGNMKHFTEDSSSGSPLYVYSTGAAWNLWAAYEQSQHPSKDINNYWNNTYAQGKIPSGADEEFEAPPDWEHEGATYIPDFTTVPIAGDPSVPGTCNPAPEPGKDWPVPPEGATDYPIWVEKDHKMETFSPPSTTTTIEDNASFREFFVQSIYDFRNLALPELRAAVTALTGEITQDGNPIYSAAKILKRPALQDTVFFQYALTGEGQLQRELGTVADQMKLAEDIITALTTISKIISLNVAVNRKIEVSDDDAKTTILDNKGYLLDGYKMLKEIYNSGRIMDLDRRTTINSVLHLASATVSLLNKEGSSVASETKVLCSWWGGNKASSLNNNALTQWENQNTTLKNNLKKAVFVYQEFVKSASSVMRKLNQIVKTAAQDVRGR
jgi:hypothetical protein